MSRKSLHRVCFVALALCVPLIVRGNGTKLFLSPPYPAPLAEPPRQTPLFSAPNLSGHSRPMLPPEVEHPEVGLPSQTGIPPQAEDFQLFAAPGDPEPARSVILLPVNKAAPQGPSPAEKPLPVEEPAETIDPGALLTPDESMSFPALPPPPDAAEMDLLPPLETELALHGGGFLYEPEGQQFNDPRVHAENEHCLLRLPETYLAPQPATAFQQFLGADPIYDRPALQWPGLFGFQWEPRFVAYGGYQGFAFHVDEGDEHQTAIGHQLLVDLDLRLTGTERMHVQYRPIGEGGSGGSYYQFSDPVGYVDNSTGAPDRWWVEGEVFSIFRGLIHDEFTPRDYHFVAGKFPLAFHNFLLLNDDVTGVIVNKNTIYCGDLSNLNVQVFCCVDDLEPYEVSSDLYGTNITADYRHMFIEATYAYLAHSRDSDRDSQYAALSATQLFGPCTLTGRALFKWGDEGGIGSGQLYVIESNYTRSFDGPLHHRLGVTHGVFYVNIFRATEGWSPISGGNFNRIRTTFEVNPLVNIARGDEDDTTGVAAGVQLFRLCEDESLTPEFAIDVPQGEPVFGIGLRYFRKTGKRTFFEAQALDSWSEDPDLERSGVFLSETLLF